LLALALERASEFAVLRAIGLTPYELGKLTIVQCALMGLIAGVLALPLGFIMSKMLIDVINQRSFGWTMGFYVPPGILLQTLLLALIAAVLAGWYPSRKLSRMSPAEALREN
jgi:putative ABC transport system permease protein